MALLSASPYRFLDIFFFSGFSALVYQVCWQRLLFAAFGVDMESITVIVSAFMFGLGIGALIGGRLADLLPQKVIYLFSFFEVSIGIFGFFSPALIGIVASRYVLEPVGTLALVNFALLVLPTSLMGATLPLLTCFLNQHLRNVGASIGSLYFVNTLGAGIGALATGLLLFDYLTINQAIYLAACLNLAVALLAFRRAWSEAS